MEILNELTDDRLFVMRRNDNGKSLLRGKNFFLFAAPQATEADKEKVQREKKNKNLHRHHDQIKDMCRKIRRDKM